MSPRISRTQEIGHDDLKSGEIDVVGEVFFVMIRISYLFDLQFASDYGFILLLAICKSYWGAASYRGTTGQSLDRESEDCHG